MSITPSLSPVVTGPRKVELQKASAVKHWHVPTPADTIPSPPQSVLGALIAVNLKNSLKQLADPFYLWKKSKLDCVSAWGRVGGTSLPDAGSSAHDSARQRPGKQTRPQQVFGEQEGGMKVGFSLLVRSFFQPLASEVQSSCRTHPAQLSTLTLSAHLREG